MTKTPKRKPRKFAGSKIIIDREVIDVVETELQCIRETLSSAFDHIEGEDEWDIHRLVSALNDILSSMENIDEMLD